MRRYVNQYDNLCFLGVRSSLSQLRRSVGSLVPQFRHVIHIGQTLARCKDEQKAITQSLSMDIAKPLQVLSKLYREIREGTARRNALSHEILARANDLLLVHGQYVQVRLNSDSAIMETELLINSSERRGG